MKISVAQLCPTLCNPMDCSPPGSSVHRILQARILEWLAIPFSRGFPDPGIKPGSPALQAVSLPSEPPGGKFRSYIYFQLKSWYKIVNSKFEVLLNQFGNFNCLVDEVFGFVF